MVLTNISPWILRRTFDRQRRLNSMSRSMRIHEKRRLQRRVDCLLATFYTRIDSRETAFLFLREGHEGRMREEG